MNKIEQELTSKIIEYIKSLKDDDYFSISIEDAKKLEILPELTERLCKIFNFDRVYFNKKEAEYFDNVHNNPKVIEFALDNLVYKSIKLKSEDGDIESTVKIYWTSIFLWLSAGINLIIKNTSDYTRFKNEIAVKMLQFSSSKKLFNLVLKEILEFLKTRNDETGYLKMLHIDLQSIYDNYNRYDSIKKVDPITNKKTLPYQIALLNEIGFFDLPKIKRLNQKKQIEILKKIIGGTDRQLKGNINVLNPQSLEDRMRYTSSSYEGEVEKFISSLSD